MGGDKRCPPEHSAKNLGGLSWEWYCPLQAVGGTAPPRLRVLLSLPNTLKVVLNAAPPNLPQAEGSTAPNRLKMVLSHHPQAEGGTEHPQHAEGGTEHCPRKSPTG